MWLMMGCYEVHEFLNKTKRDKQVEHESTGSGLYPHTRQGLGCKLKPFIKDHDSHWKEHIEKKDEVWRSGTKGWRVGVFCANISPSLWSWCQFITLIGWKNRSCEYTVKGQKKMKEVSDEKNVSHKSLAYSLLTVDPKYWTKCPIHLKQYIRHSVGVVY